MIFRSAAPNPFCSRRHLASLIFQVDALPPPLPLEERIASAENPGGIAPVVVAAAVAVCFQFSKKTNQAARTARGRHSLTGVT